MDVNVTVLYFDGCPGWQTAIESVDAASARTGVPVQVSTLAVESEKDADRLGFAGSPTILLNGTDPFAALGGIPALACRLYATPAGLAGSPTVDQLVEALAHVPRRRGYTACTPPVAVPGRLDLDGIKPGSTGVDARRLTSQLRDIPHGDRDVEG